MVVSMVFKRTSRRWAEKKKCIMNCLPRELIEEIFFRLPANCLLQCIYVCKMWRSIIRDSKFAMAHLQHAPSCTLMFSPKGSSSGNLYPSDAILFDEAWSPSTWAVPVIGPDDLLCGTCNGLLCLHTPTSTIKIANLATGECLYLKKPTKSLKGDHFSFYRFGFFPAKKEYKVIHFLQESSTFTEGRFNVIQVYTLGDEKWKDIPTSEALSLNCMQESGVVIVDGAMYWLTEDRATSWQHAVMSFDLGEENFAKISLPTVDQEDWEFGVRRYWIKEINGKVCVSTAQSLSGMLFGKLQIWTLNGNVDQRWSHMYTIQLSSFTQGLHFAHGDRIVIQEGDSNLYSYELLGRKKNLEIEFSNMVKLLNLSPREKDDMQFYVYVKSLVPLNVYAKASIVYRPKRQGGWKLKKWEVWNHEQFSLEKMSRRIHQIGHEIQEYTQKLGIRVKEISRSLPVKEISQRLQDELSMEIDQILQRLPSCPDQHPIPVRRFNWVEKMMHLEKLEACMDGVKDLFEAANQVKEDIVSIFETYVDAYCQATSVIPQDEAESSEGVSSEKKAGTRKTARTKKSNPRFFGPQWSN